jgi:hypothetical protein
MAKQGVCLRRAFPVSDKTGHGFVSSQPIGVGLFATIPPDASLVFATAAWQYAHHVLEGMRDHPGPILTVANWSGLVSLPNLNGLLVKPGVNLSTLWSKDFDGEYFLSRLAEWVQHGRVSHDLSHVFPLHTAGISCEDMDLGRELARRLKTRKAILGIFDEGWMGMYHAIIEDKLLNPAGFYKERLSQSPLVARMHIVSDEEAIAVRRWLDQRCLQLKTGPDPAHDLTDEQIHKQCKMYIAVVRMADEFSCDAIRIHYQQCLKDMTPASDLVKGLFNNAERPPILRGLGGEELYPGGPLSHFNEVDECARFDAVATNIVWRAFGLDPSTTLDDLRWGETYVGQFVWLLQISGAAPANHLDGGYAGASSERQPAVYFPLGGGTLRRVGRTRPIVGALGACSSASILQ